MSRPLQAITFAILGTTIAIRTVFGLCMWGPFEDDVGLAEIIFAGTVTKVESERIPRTIVTRYRFDNVRYVKGSGPTDSLILVGEGGTVGNVRMKVSDGVSFRNGTRYVVFADRGHEPLPKEYMAMPCGEHPFGIWPDSGTAVAVAHRGGVVVVFDERHLVTMVDRPWRPGDGLEQDEQFARSNPGVPPPRRSVADLLAVADSIFDRRVRYEVRDSLQAVTVASRLRKVYLWPHQDPGNRVTEDELLRTLARFVARTPSGSRGDSIPAR